VTLNRNPRGRVVLRLVLGIALAFCALGLLAPAASAHASLVSTDPAEGAVLASAPAEITLTFDEPVTLAASSSHLYDAQGAEVAAEARSVDRVVTVTPGEAMPHGTYVVTYRVISSDGHPVTGSLSFSVGAPSETVVAPGTAGGETSSSVTVLHSLVQGITYAALFLAAGLAVFVVLLLPAAGGLEVLRWRLRRVMRRAAVVAATGAVLLVPIGVTYQQGLGLDGLATGTAWTGWGSADALVAALIGLGLAGAAAALTPGAPTRQRAGVVMASAGLALAAVALVGHTRSYGPPVLVVISDVVHVLAAATWFGGLVGLTISLPTLSKRERLAATALARFSVVAGGLLAAVAVAGLLLGWRILGSWSGLVETTYGLILLSKTFLVGLVVLVAGWNRYRLLPRVHSAAGYQGRVEAAGRLRTAVRAEAGGLVVVLMLTGFLVNQVPRAESAGVAADRASTMSAAADDVRVVAHLHPGRVGSNTLVVQVQNLAGEPLEPVAAPVVELASGELDLGSRPMQNIDSGTYETDVVIPSAGTWQIRVSVRTGTFVNPVLTLQTEVAGRAD
jgi:copper transport protein